MSDVSCPAARTSDRGFFQRCACAFADDFALATASLRESLPIRVEAFRTIEKVASMSLKPQDMPLDPIEEFGYPTARQMQIKDHAKDLGVDIGLGAAGHRWNMVRNTFVGVCARIRTSS